MIWTPPTLLALAFARSAVGRVEVLKTVDARIEILVGFQCLPPWRTRKAPEANVLVTNQRGGGEVAERGADVVRTVAPTGPAQHPVLS